MTLPRILFALSLAASALPALANVTLFADTFDTGASAAWGNERGQWRAADGSYDASLPSNSPTTYSSVTTLTALTDFTVEVDVNNWNDGGVWLRSSFSGGLASGVLLVTGGSGGSYNGLYWHTVSNDAYAAPSGHLSIAGIQGGNRHLTISVSGNQYTACVGSDCSTLSSSLFASGSVGLYDFSPVSKQSSPRGQTFDNFHVTVVPEPSKAMLTLAGLALVGIALRASQARARWTPIRGS